MTCRVRRGGGRWEQSDPCADPPALPPAGPGPVQPAQPRRVGSTVLRAAGAGAPAHRVLRGPQAQGGAAVQHDCALLQVQLSPCPARPAGPAASPSPAGCMYLRTPPSPPLPAKPTSGPIKGGERTRVSVSWPDRVSLPMFLGSRSTCRSVSSLFVCPPHHLPSPYVPCTPGKH